jgi:nicotinamide-nucleotide amidase
MRETVAAAELDYVVIDAALIQRGVESLGRAKRSGLRVVTAESCTGGLIALVLSEAPGAAEHLEGGFVVYTPAQKCAALRLDSAMIDKHGAVSAEVARAMALGALLNSDADIALSVTGVAGPEPDERGNPVGLVYFACARRNGPCESVERQFGDIGRSRIRYEAACEGLRLIENATAS